MVNGVPTAVGRANRLFRTLAVAGMVASPDPGRGWGLERRSRRRARLSSWPALIPRPYLLVSRLPASRNGQIPSHPAWLLAAIGRSRLRPNSKRAPPTGGFD